MSYKVLNPIKIVELFNEEPINRIKIIEILYTAIYNELITHDNNYSVSEDGTVNWTGTDGDKMALTDIPTIISNLFSTIPDDIHDELLLILGLTSVGRVKSTSLDRFEYIKIKFGSQNKFCNGVANIVGNIIESFLSIADSTEDDWADYALTDVSDSNPSLSISKNLYWRAFSVIKFSAYFVSFEVAKQARKKIIEAN